MTVKQFRLARAFDKDKTLGEIVKAVRVRGKRLHPALARSLSSLYGYAGDEKWYPTFPG